MRSIACALGIVLVAFCQTSKAASESTGSTWWPFGHHDEAKTAPPVVGMGGSTPMAPPGSIGPTTPSTPIPPTATPGSTSSAAKDENWMLKSSKSKVSWPHLTKPSNPLAKKETPANAAKNSWAEKQPTPPKPSLMKPVTDGAHKVAQGTKNVWHKTVNALTPGKSEPSPHSPSSHVAKHDAEPSFWQKMFGSKEEVKQPETVPQWMAQKRLEP